MLLVDDEPALVSLGQRILKRQGYRVTGVSRAADALAAMRAEPGAFDLVVADYNMPGVTGLDLARAIWAEWPGFPVVLASGNVTEALQAEAAAGGIQQVLRKPYSTDDLCATVARVLPPT